MLIFADFSFAVQFSASEQRLCMDFSSSGAFGRSGQYAEYQNIRTRYTPLALVLCFNVSD